MSIKVYKLNLVTNELGQGELIPQIVWTQRNYSSRCNQCHWGPLDKEIITSHEDGTINVSLFVNEFENFSIFHLVT